MRNEEKPVLNCIVWECPICKTFESVNVNPDLLPDKWDCELFLKIAYIHHKDICPHCNASPKDINIYVG